MEAHSESPIEVWTKVLDAVLGAKTLIQLTLLTLVILSLLAINVTADKPLLPSICVFSVVPILAAMHFIGNLKKMQQFVIILVFCFLSALFLGAGLLVTVNQQALAAQAQDTTDSKAADYREHFQQFHGDIERQILPVIFNKIALPLDYNAYRALVLDRWSKICRNSAGNGRTIDAPFDALVSFVEEIASCRTSGRCRTKQVDKYFGSIFVDIWYTFRPVVEDKRAGLWGRSFALGLQEEAERLLAPAIKFTSVSHSVLGADCGLPLSS
jgi:hypothetical protein